MIQFDLSPQIDSVLILILGLCLVCLLTLLELHKRSLLYSAMDGRLTTIETDLARYMGIVVSEPGVFHNADLPEGEVKKKQ